MLPVFHPTYNFTGFLVCWERSWNEQKELGGGMGGGWGGGDGGLWVTKASFLGAADCIQAPHSWASPWRRLEGNGSWTAEQLPGRKKLEVHGNQMRTSVGSGLRDVGVKHLAEWIFGFACNQCPIFYISVLVLGLVPVLLQRSFNFWTSATCNYGLDRFRVRSSVCVSVCVCLTGKH